MHNFLRHTHMYAYARERGMCIIYIYIYMKENFAELLVQPRALTYPCIYTYVRRTFPRRFCIINRPQMRHGYHILEVLI